MRLCSSLVAIATSLLVAACGGSSPTSTAPGTATATATATAAAASSQTTTSAASTQATADGGASTTTTTTSSASAPPEVPKAKKHEHHASSPAASQGAHVETTVILSGVGDVSPPVVSVPSGVGVEIHVTNHGSAAATVALAVPAHPSAHIAPGASAIVETGGLKDGSYQILVNGTPRGQLMIGAQGGP